KSRKFFPEGQVGGWLGRSGCLGKEFSYRGMGHRGAGRHGANGAARNLTQRRREGKKAGRRVDMIEGGGGATLNRKGVNDDSYKATGDDRRFVSRAGKG